MDDLAGLTPDPATPAVTPPAAPVVDIEERFKQMEATFETRIKGFQTSLNEKDRALKTKDAELREALEASMSEDERRQNRTAERDAEIEELRQQNTLLMLAREYPEEVPLFEEILKATDPKEQLELIRKLRAVQAAAPAQDPAAEPDPDVPPVDPNNPRRVADYGDGQTFNGQPMTDDWARKILEAGRPA